MVRVLSISLAALFFTVVHAQEQKGPASHDRSMDTSADQTISRSGQTTAPSIRRFSDPVLKSRTELKKFMRANADFRASVQERIDDAQGFAEPLATGLSNLDLSDINQAVDQNFFLLRKLYCEDVVTDKNGPALDKIINDNALALEAIPGFQGMSGGCRIDYAGNLMFRVYVESEANIYPALEALAKISDLVSFLGGTYFQIEAIGEITLGGPPEDE